MPSPLKVPSLFAISRSFLSSSVAVLPIVHMALYLLVFVFSPSEGIGSVVKPPPPSILVISLFGPIRVFPELKAPSMLSTRISTGSPLRTAFLTCSFSAISSGVIDLFRAVL